MSGHFIFFGILSILAIASGIVTITNKNPVASAVSLVFHFFMLAGLYLTLQAQFVAVIQVLVYAGAIMVLVIFVIMLLSLGDEKKLIVRYNSRMLLGVVLAGFFVILFGKVFLADTPIVRYMSVKAEKIGTAQYIGEELYSYYILPFEATGILLLLAIVGAVLLAKRRLD